jgi:dTDP-4-dehydrorhamnose 3,5-epimerase
MADGAVLAIAPPRENVVEQKRTKAKMVVAPEQMLVPRLVRSKFFGDQRGWFNQIYASDLSEPSGALAGMRFVQDNASLSMTPGTVRGLHFQLSPSAQDKLVTVLAGAIYDVAVDVRRSSPTFGTCEAVELRGGTGDQFLIPAGFAHGFMTLEPNTVVFYKVSNPYAPALERGIAWNDPALGIAWPMPAAVLSDKDASLPVLRDADEIFP